MKIWGKILVTTAVLTGTVLGSYGGYAAGVYIESRSHARIEQQKQAEQEKLEIKNGCAHYDMETGKFVWGAKPAILVMELTSKGKSSN